MQYKLEFVTVSKVLALVWCCFLLPTSTANGQEGTTVSISVAPLSASEAKQKHCQVAIGDWCGPYYTQTPEPRPPAPQGNKPCPKNCNNVGNCDFDTGMCYCPVGYGGEDCTAPRKRPCLYMNETSKMDLGPTKYHSWSHSRCSGICDEDTSMCYCPPNTKYGHILAPEGSPPNTPPVKRGRPLYMCNPSTDAAGNPIKWGGSPYEDLLGPNGWCNADLPVPPRNCPCRIDGWVGDRCHIAIEHNCANQCNGHGDCYLGFCKCKDGYYGQGCERRRQGVPAVPGDEVDAKPWLREVVNPVMAALEGPSASPTRKRPYIYLYDLKPEYNTDILQYRIERSHGVYREFHLGNSTGYVGYNGYGTEPLLHELFMTSEHRTFDPEEADFFYMPTYTANLADVYGWNKIPMWPDGVHGTRTYGMSNMVRGAAQWVAANYPYFNRSGGADHIWFWAHDEGACSAPNMTWAGIHLTHWGRMDMPHLSNTAYGADNYSLEQPPLPDLPGSWLAHTSKAHPCYDPIKDLVIPNLKSPMHMAKSPYMGATQEPRDILMFFRGDVGRVAIDDPTCRYSRCIRQRLYNLSKIHQWRDTYKVYYGSRGDTPGDYGEQLARSVFSFVLPGDGYATRLEDTILHGCIPVIIQDNVHVAFESILDVSSFAVRIAEKDLDRVIQIVQALTPAQVAEKQANVNKVWHRYRYNGNKQLQASVKWLRDARKVSAGGTLPPQPGGEWAETAQDDAFSTILQWLMSRIPAMEKARAAIKGS